ncbi:hypothetical protein GUITHDRAFT_152986 [Guillardia theta CCMP2712]|uniref:Uncharacterized protein n=1 Tax=Guillardia theta (strain CCMP2712) TaxID=905079 RepID=L1J861_GUITC|nr:hypothetical protein GUITHDRAFT_152986 [Guillardia theta CCMP2712]EKX44527.1 hypothetical protein GUITHDRAFT_152986 [Guillardia theta CCMP2712]|eukprot:XP_005831507.1 hypothetical protein GUITHDRAFT_152986 [Guillardia theta CCMP2712]
MFALLEACRLKACAVNDAAELQAVKPARMMEMASVHVGVDNDYSFSGPKAEEALLAKSRVHGNRLPRFLLSSTRSY